MAFLREHDLITIPPRDVAEIVVHFDSKGQIGRFRGVLQFQTNDPDTSDQLAEVIRQACGDERRIGFDHLDPLGTDLIRERGFEVPKLHVPGLAFAGDVLRFREKLLSRLFVVHDKSAVNTERN